MRDLAPSGVSSTLRIRRVEHGGKTYVQFVNAASWPENVDIRFKSSVDTVAATFGCIASDNGQIIPVGNDGVVGDTDQPAEKMVRAGQPEVLRFTVAAYGLVGVCLESEQVELLEVTSSPPKDLSGRMETRLSNLQKLIDRAGELNEQQTLGLRGGDFETWESNTVPLVGRCRHIRVHRLPKIMNCRAVALLVCDWRTDPRAMLRLGFKVIASLFQPLDV